LSAEKQTHNRLRTCLDKLGTIKSIDLTRETALGQQLSFRAGMPFFERTLSLYRQVANTNLSRVPSAILEIALNHAEESLRQLDQIEAFAPAGIDRPEQIRNLLINDVRDTHAAIYDDLCILLAPSRPQIEKASWRTGLILMMIVLVLVLVGATFGYRYSLVGGLIYSVRATVVNLFAH
jgi:hypothetical protein